MSPHWERKLKYVHPATVSEEKVVVPKEPPVPSLTSSTTLSTSAPTQPKHKTPSPIAQDAPPQAFFATQREAVLAELERFRESVRNSSVLLTQKQTPSTTHNSPSSQKKRKK